IDGANRWQEFWSMTWPLLLSTTLFTAVMTTIGYLQIFEEPFVMTQGGPLNRTSSVSIYMYQQGFNFFHLGYASAIAYTMFVVIAAGPFLHFRLLRNGTGTSLRAPRPFRPHVVGPVLRGQGYRYRATGGFFWCSR